MAEEKPNEEEKDQEHPREHTPPSSSPRHDNNPRKRKNVQDLLSNCHSCGRHFPAKSPQTLTDLRILDSQWRIVLLCSDCLRLVRSAANCSYCFSPIPDGESQFLDCCQCSCRVHVSCVPRQCRLFSPFDLDPKTFACVDCCPLPRFFGRRNPSLSVYRVSLEELTREAARKGTLADRAKEKAAEKVRIAKRAADRARVALDAVTRPGIPASRSEDEVAKDEELALQLHLAMNGSRRILSCGQAKADPVKNGRVDARAELSMEDKGFLDSWVPPAVKIEPKKEIAKVEGNNIGIVLKYCRRAVKLNGSMVIEKNKGDDKLDRYLMKYIRKSKLESGMNQKDNQVVPSSQLTCSKTSSLSDAPLSSSSGCQS